jgi:hypothetical protein
LISGLAGITDLTAGRNGKGKTPLNQVNGALILLRPATVHMDASVDTLTGSTNTDPMTLMRVHNWFFRDGDDPVWMSFLNGWDKQMKET